ncbi:MAG: hypothetical protein GC159_17565 [Phycisphaera sp.]|nr:hypothetical protein [Phycisphaera sp.]
MAGSAGPLCAADAPRAEPVLAARADVAAKLAALEPGHGVILGNAAVVGEFNDTATRFELDKTGPRARDFTLKMCWAADRGRALYCGANHQVPHRINDVWEFDLPALTWVMLYAPDLPRGYGDLGRDTSDVLFSDGLLYTKRGGPAVIAHTWWGLTYDPTRHALQFMNTWVTKRKEAVEALGGDPGELYEGPPLWSFDPWSRTWQAHKTDAPRPRPIFGGMLEYIPDLKGTIWHANNWQMRATWLYDPAGNTWKNLDANGPGNDGAKAFESNAPEPEQIGYYDPARHLVVVQRHYATNHYDVKTNKWTKVLNADQSDEATPYGHDAHAVFYHDPNSGHGLLVQFDTNTLWSYDPDAMMWTRLDIAGDPMPTGGKRLAYVDPKANVVVVIDRTTVWAYRYKAE